MFYAGTSQTLGIADGNAHPTIHRDVTDRAAEARRRTSASAKPLFNLPTCYNAQYCKPKNFKMPSICMCS